MAVGRFISGRTTVATSGTPVALSATRRMVRDLQVQAAILTGGTMVAGGSDVHATTQRGVILPAYNADIPVTRIVGPIDLRQVYVDANSDNQSAVWIATEAE